MRQVIAVTCGVFLAFGSVAPAPANNLFKDLDYPSLLDARAAVQDALETREKDQTLSWRVAGVATGEVTPLRTWRSASGHWCRAYRETVRLTDGQTYAFEGVRCRIDGRWKAPTS